MESKGLALALEEQALDQLCINTIRTLAMDAVQKAKSGHPGMPMGAAPMAYVLWTRFLRHNPSNPQWPNRDRFVLSAGHGSMLIYALLHLTGYDLPLEELKRFRQWGSRTPGHPEYGHTPGVETTTGPLGQGFGNGVGMAIAEAFLAAHYNRPGHEIVDHHTYAIVSDGDLMEGVASEAASLAAHLKLGKLIYLYDDNQITIEGSTALAFSEDVAGRFQAYGWHTQRLDGNDLDGLQGAIEAAQHERERPSLIVVQTHIAYGSPNKQGTAAAHGAPLGEEEVARTKEVYGWPVDQHFYIPEDALAHFREAVSRGRALEADWNARFESYAAAHPELAQEWLGLMSGKLPEDWANALPKFAAESKPIATREASGKVINAIAPKLPTLIGGSADLAPSTETLIKDSGDFEAENYGGRNLHFGVREHAMGATVNGMALHGGLIPYGATFLIFSDYMRPAIRLAALMRVRVIHVFTHDSIGLGEDGPTHQPIEHLAALRAMPNVMVIRPADANETTIAWRVAIERKDGPVLFALTRQKLPVIDRTKCAPAEGLARGGYILLDHQGERLDVILLATGSEVSLALGAHAALSGEGIGVRVVSMPCMELFDREPKAYRDLVLPPAITARLAIEAAAPQSWHRYVAPQGDVLGLTTYGASAPYEDIFKEMGFTVENVVRRAKALIRANLA